MSISSRFKKLDDKEAESKLSGKAKTGIKIRFTKDKNQRLVIDGHKKNPESSSNSGVEKENQAEKKADKRVDNEKEN